VPEPRKNFFGTAIAVITQQKKSTTKQGGKAMRAANEKGAEVKIIIRP